MGTRINWTNQTWNPIIGCTKISEGCKNCYAEKMAFRLTHIENTYYYGNVVKYDQKKPKWNGKTYFNSSALEKPFRWKKPRMIFVCSMSDLFHESTPFEWIEKVWDVMCQTPQHTYQILTKRPERMLEFYKWLGDKCRDYGFDSVPSSSDDPLDYISTPDHIWIGVTTENQKQVDKRIPILLEIPAKVRFVSCEPLLSNIDINKWIHDSDCMINQDGICTCYEPREVCIDWVIAGPETGPLKRPMQKEWIENIHQQCKDFDVPFFDKKML